jgi:outer membrane protein assembly factor BamB
VKFTARVAVPPLVLTIVILAAFAAVPTGAQTAAATVSFLFDLGDGTYAWSRVEIPDPATPNATWNATLEAATLAGIDLDWTWFDCCGAAVLDMEDRDPPAGFVGLFLWNATSRAWDLAPVGLSSLVLRDGDAVALFNAAFGGIAFETRTPVPTPTHPYPSVAFRGDLANRGVAPSPIAERPSVLWDRDLGVAEIGSTPVVAYGRVFVTTLDGLFALDARTGETLWANPEVRGFSSPTVFSGLVIAGSSDGRIYAVDAVSGGAVWNATLLEETGFSGITSSPKVWYDRAFIGVFNESGGPGAVVALWVRNGSVAWRTSTSSVHFSSPAIADGTAYVGLMGLYNTTTQITYDPPFGVVALDAMDGSERWTFETEDSVAASPVVTGNLVIAASKDGRVYGIDRAAGTEVWRASADAGVSSPALSHSTLYIGGGSFGGPGRLTALDAGTGTPQWAFEPNGPVQASVTYASGRVVFSTNAAQGTIYAVDVTTHAAAFTYTPSPAQFILGSPVVADGVLYAPSDNGHVYAFHDAATTGPVFVDSAALAVVGAGIVAIAAAVAVAVRARRLRRGP